MKIVSYHISNRAMIKSLSEENGELKKNLSLAGSTQNELKVSCIMCMSYALGKVTAITITCLEATPCVYWK